MITYKGTTYCASPNCTCDRALTPEIEAAAERAGMALSMAYLCGEEGAETERCYEPYH